MNLRPGVYSDITEIMAIEQIPAYRLFIGQWSESEHRQAMESSDVLYLVAQAEGRGVEGFAILRGLENKDHSLELKRVAIRTPNIGLGRKLLREALRLSFEEHQAHRLWLDVFEENARAQHVYESFGFRVDGLFREAVLVDGRYYSQRLMSILDREYRSRFSGCN